MDACECAIHACAGLNALSTTCLHDRRHFALKSGWRPGPFQQYYRVVVCIELSLGICTSSGLSTTAQYIFAFAEGSFTIDETFLTLSFEPGKLKVIKRDSLLKLMPAFQKEHSLP